AGDFSQTLVLNGQLVRIIDPATGQQFPNNIIPAARINRNGQALLNVFPLPNRLDRNLTSGNYNFEWEDSLDVPKLAQVLRLDFNLTSKDSIFIRGRRWRTDTFGFEPGAGWSGGAPLFIHRYLFTDSSGQVGYTRVFSPRLVNEFNIGIRGLGEFGQLNSDSDYSPVQRSTVGYTLGQLFPAANTLALIPQMAFGGVPGAASVNYDTRFPIDAGDHRVNLSNNISWAKGNHNPKFGIYAEWGWASEGPRANAAQSGRFDFSRDPNNLCDSGYAYAHAVLGTFRQYSETNKRNLHKGKNNVFEFFAQDTWKATRKLTLSYGLRFSTFSPWMLRGRTEGAALVLERFNPASAPAFYQPALDQSGRRVARDPISGQIFPAPYIGAYVPNSGDPVNGMVLSSDTS
ncbi:MAG: hypothetical protein ACREBC_32790, partial [Pyrinomonadaceae bacterium]